MPNRTLTATAVERLKPPATGQIDHFDQGYPGLGLRVSCGGTKAWVYFFRLHGKQKRLTLGRWPSMSLAGARDAWRDARKTGGQAHRRCQARRCHADQVLREVAAEFLIKRIPLPNELADYAAVDLLQANSSKKQSHKTDYHDWILALTVDDIVRHFQLNPTRNDATKKHCGCSIVTLATERHENTIQNAWHRYQGIADQRTATNYVAQAIVSLTSDRTRGYLVRFPRIGSTEAMSRPKRRNDSAKIGS